MASTINSSTSNGIVITPDTSGEIELQANGVTKAKITANGLQDANGASLRGGSFRNLIINGDMQVAQRGTSATGITGTTYNTIDRYKTDMNVAGTWTQTQSTDVPTGQGFSTSLKMDCTTANANLASNAWLRISQTFEGQMLQHLKKGTSSAESVTLSFWVKSNKTGTYIMELRDGDNTRDISKSYTIDTADTWEKKTITYAGDTSGAFDNDNGGSLVLEMWLASGTDRSSGTLQTSWGTVVNANRAAGQVNLADSTSNYINITGCQLEIGEGASDFEFLPYDVQLARCKRYYEAISKTAIQDNICNAHCWNTTTAYGVLQYATKRAAPSLTLTAADYVIRSGGSTINVTSTNISQLTIDRCQFGLTASGLTTGRGAWLAFDSDTVSDQKLEISAEL